MSELALDPYEQLEVHPRASQEVIAAAYRALARRFHPDVSPDPADARRMVAINHAWELLRDPTRRARHDEEQAQQRAAQAAAAAPPAPRPAVDVRGAEGAAGPPRGMPYGTRIHFGFYKGWTLVQILRADPAYLTWLEGDRRGQPYLVEVDRLLRNAGLRVGADAARREPRSRFG